MGIQLHSAMVVGCDDGSSGGASLNVSGCQKGVDVPTETLSARARTIWEEALGVEVERDTDFFEMGGHSFMAMRIIAKLDEACGARIPLRSLFDNPRFADFVVAVDQELSHQQELHARHTSPTGKALPLGDPPSGLVD